MRPRNRWRNILISPRFQGRVALVFAAIVLLGGVFFALLAYHDVKQALWDASMRGHYGFRTPYGIVGVSLARHLAGLFAAAFVVGAVAFLLVIRTIRNGIGGIVSSLKASAEGDLSTPTPASGMEEIAAFGRQLDEVRRTVLLKLVEIRGEAGRLAGEGPPQELFRAEWDALKRKIGEIAP